MFNIDDDNDNDDDDNSGGKNDIGYRKDYTVILKMI